MGKALNEADLGQVSGGTISNATKAELGKLGSKNAAIISGIDKNGKFIRFAIAVEDLKPGQSLEKAAYDAAISAGVSTDLKISSDEGDAAVFQGYK